MLQITLSAYDEAVTPEFLDGLVTAVEETFGGSNLSSTITQGLVTLTFDTVEIESPDELREVFEETLTHVITDPNDDTIVLSLFYTDAYSTIVFPAEITNGQATEEDDGGECTFPNCGCFEDDTPCVDEPDTQDESDSIKLGYDGKYKELEERIDSLGEVADALVQKVDELQKSQQRNIFSAFGFPDFSTFPNN